jgi:uncharacterized protein (TIGR00725 family)
MLDWVNSKTKAEDEQNMTKVISIFGSSQPQPGSVDYEQARAVGRLLAEAGYAVATGGYGGTMAAVSQGAAEAGGHVIGIGSARIERYRQDGLNGWVKEAHSYESLNERLLHLVTHNDGMIALPGGIGTISEVTLAWSLLQVSEIEPRPFALLGAIWQQTFITFYDPTYIREKDWDLIYFAETAATAVAHVT